MNFYLKRFVVEVSNVGQRTSYNWRKGYTQFLTTAIGRLRCPSDRSCAAGIGDRP